MMKISLGSRRQLALLAVLAGLLILALVRSGRNEPVTAIRVGRSAEATPSEGEERPGRAGPRATGKKVTVDDLPLLTRQDFDAAETTPGPASRNIFDSRPPTPRPPPTATPAPPPAPVCGEALFMGPCPPPPPTPTPQAPEIPFKFIGSFGPKDHPIAVLVAAGKVVNARAGDIVFDRFIVKKVGYESVDIGFLGPWTNVQRLPISP